MNYNFIHDWYATVLHVNLCIHKYQFYLIVIVYFVFNVTFIAVSAISWWSVLLVAETGIHGENHRQTASYWRNLITYKKCLKMPKWKSEAVNWRTDKTMDNWTNTHDTFLEQPSSGTLIVKRLERQIIQIPNNLNMVEIRCSGRVNTSCSTSCIHGKKYNLCFISDIHWLQK